MTEFTDEILDEAPNSPAENDPKPTIAGESPIIIEVEAGKSYWWCACGKSSKQPFCDGSHKGSCFSPVKYTAEKTEKVAFCTCKHSQHTPRCDGTHKRLGDLR